MRQIVPVLYVESIPESMRFYREVLGFSQWFLMEGAGGEVVAGGVEYGGARIILSDGAHLTPEEKARRGAGVELYIDVGDADIDAYYERVRTRARVTDPIADRPWGDRVFTVADPDGFLLSFYKEPPRS